ARRTTRYRPFPYTTLFRSIDGEPADVAAIVADYAVWLAEGDVPKLFVNAEPGAIVRGRVRDFVRSWPNQTEITVAGRHYIQEDKIGRAHSELQSRENLVCR